MNKRKIVVLSLITLSLLTSCKSKQEREFDRFINSKGVDLTLELEMSVQSVNVNMELCNIVATKNIMELSFEGLDGKLITDRKNKKQYYSSKTQKIYTDYEEEENEEDIGFISDINVDEDQLYFYINVDDMLSTSLPNQDDSLGIDSIKVVVDFKNDKVDYLYMDLLEAVAQEEQIKEALEQSGITKMGVKIEVNNYGRVKAPTIEEKDYEFVGEVEFSEVVSSQLIESIYSSILGTGNNNNNNNNTNNPPVFDPRNYYLNLPTSYYVLQKGETLELKGAIRRVDGNFENIPAVELYLNKDIDFNVPGKYSRNVNCMFNGHLYEAQIFVLVVDFKETTKVEFEFLDEINKIFSYDDTYVLFSDEQYLYKYNVKTNTTEGKVDLKCIAKDVYFKDEYLYVLAHYPYTTTYLEEDSYNSTITKIKLSDFSLVDQMTIDCLGYSFFVDKYDNIIISKGANQHIKYMLVNLEEKTKENIITGYQDDYLVYKEEKDAFLVITQGDSSSNYYLSYKDGQYSNEKIQSSCSSNRVICSDKEDNLIISQYSNHSDIMVGYNVYDNELQDYVSYNKKIGEKLISAQSSYSTIYCNEDTIYFYDKMDGFNVAQIIEYDIETKTSKEIIIETKEEISFIRSIDSKLYLFLKESNDAIVVEI